MIVFPHCKINIGLFVTGKRSDGYHSIESIFAPVDWRDVLEVNINSTEECTLRVSGINIDGSADENIVVKAYRLLKQRFPIQGVDLHLLKNLPTGAGLGGGSADGTYTLKALNDLFSLNISKDQLEEFASQLGSDCPFFVGTKPAYVSGRGEVLEEINLNLSSFYVMILHPGIHVSTAQAYSMITPSSASFDLRQIASLDISEWKTFLRNDFEKPMIEAYPIIGNYIDQLYKGNALYAAMSGSGSAVYGIFSSKEKMMQAASSINATSARLYTGKFL